MNGTNVSIGDALAKTAGLAGSLLSSLNDAFDKNAGGAGLFDKLLADIRTTTAALSNSKTGAVVASASVSASASGAGAPSSLMTALRDVTSALHDFVAKWRNATGQNQANQGQDQSGSHVSAAKSGNDKTTAASSSGSNSAANTTSDSTPSAATDNTTTVTIPSTVVTNTGDTSDTSGNNTTDPVPTIDDLLTELQLILNMIQQQIQPAQVATAGTDVATDSLTGADTTTTTPAPTDTTDAASNTSPSSGTDNQAGLLAAADMLAELMLLAQLTEKKLGISPNADPAATSVTDATAPQTPTDALASLDTQLRADLKALLDELKQSVAANTPTATDATATAATNDTSGDTTAPATTTTLTAAVTDSLVTDIPAPPAKPETIIASTLAAADDILKQLNDVYKTVTNAAPPAPAAGAVIALTTAAQGNNTPSDADLTKDGAQQGQTPAASINTNLAVGVDSAKSSNPYAFASQLSALRAANGGATGLPSVVDQVIMQLSRNIKGGNDQMTVQLNPAELGRINIKIEVGADGKVQGTVVANNPATLDLLLKDVRSLERALQDAGLRADPGSLQFSLGGQPGDTQGQTNNGGQANANGNTNGLGDEAVIDPALADAATSADTWYITPGRVNFQV